jgi:hypothetical protein
MKTDNVQGTCISELLRAVEMWWNGKCPVDWRKKEHFLNPEINCVGANEKRLARAAAGFFRPLPDVEK